MCGITGYINTDLQPVSDTSCIISMLKVQKHRGPDDSGIKAFSLSSGQSLDLNVKEPSYIGVSFEGVVGFNRLSILDLSSNGHQPMSSPDNKVFLTLNGEIYNAFDYKHELEQWGYSFKSTTDTEVVLALYLKYGFEGMLDRLNGMFAIVIADLVKKELYLTRDRFGIKPMYFIHTDKLFAFSSELKSFMYLDGFNFDLVEEQIDEYLLFRNNINGTLYRGIESIQPGQYLIYRHGIGLEVKRFFDVESYTRSAVTSGDLSTYGEKLEGWLSKSVKGQLISDVRLGCQLSGGIDSSLVTWLANRSSNGENFEAVSIILNDTRFSEERYIDFVTENLSIPSHKFLLDSDYYIDNFERVTWHLEAPVNHPNTIGIYKLSQRAKDHVTVLLSGEGADEVFGGYTRFYDISYPFRFRKLFNEARKNLKKPVGMAGYFDKEYRAVMATSYMTPGMAESLRDGFNTVRATRNRRSLYQTLSGSLFDRQVKYELKTYLPDLLIRQDKMSMAHSIENRVPFLDNELVENSFAIPEKYLLLRKSPEGKNTEKYLLKKMTAGRFGNDFAFRNKMGFGIPLREFFLNRKFTERLNDSILPGIKKRGLFNYPQVAGWVSDIGKINFSELEALWVVASFEMWASIYLGKGIK
jgi:asparagine synthase (glutamine-hydrolysing)